VWTTELAEIGRCLLKLMGANILVTLGYHKTKGNSLTSVLRKQSSCGVFRFGKRCLSSQ